MSKLPCSFSARLLMLASPFPPDYLDTVVVIKDPKASATAKSNRHTAKRPSHRLAGIGRSAHLYSEDELLREWHSEEHPCSCRHNAHTPSRLPLVVLSLPGVTRYNPLQPILRMGNLCCIA